MLCCPIGRQTVLVGRSANCGQALSVEELNLASAELSREFFVAGLLSPNFEDLRQVIGRRSEILADEEIRKLIPKEMPPLIRA
jgi:hypothetical protein